MLNPSTFLSPQERITLSEKNDWKAFLEIAHTWLWIVAAFVLVAYFPNIFTILIALFILGGKQLACAIIMHDAGHYALFKDKRTNDFVGKWLGAYPVMNNLLDYRDYHIQHHLTTGTSEDPDVSLTKGYPTTLISMLRKIGRDLMGVTGLKNQLGLLYMHLGYLKYTGSKEVKKLYVEGRTWKQFFTVAWKNLHGPVLANLLIFSVLAVFGQAWLYLIWVGAMLTTYNFCLRIRSMAEHSMIEDSEDDFKNTRTTKANWIERMLFAPHYVNYHVEHHLMMGVPPYNLPKMHQILQERGFYKKGVMAQGYGEILRKAIVKSK